MEYTPPPLFKQGASARAKAIFFAMLSLCLLLIDARLQTLTVVRQTLATVLYPLQMLALAPRDAVNSTGSYFSSIAGLQKEVRDLKQQQILNAQATQKAQFLERENAHLRQLLGAQERLALKSVVGEILYDTPDAFTRKLVLDRGQMAGVNIGQPVIDSAGVVGQVTRVFPFTSEVTLLTDKNQAIPVQVARNGLRSIAYGRGGGMLDLHFMAANADIKPGDILMTSGIDGVYPPGLNVARVVNVESHTSNAFGRIVCEPLAGLERQRQLLILLTNPQDFPPRPPVVEDPKAGKKHTKASATASVTPPPGTTPTPGTSPTPAPATAARPTTTPTPVAVQAAVHPPATHVATHATATPVPGPRPAATPHPAHPSPHPTTPAHPVHTTDKPRGQP